MPAPDPLISREQLENRLSRRVVERLYDDSNTGEADVDALEQLRRDASSKVRGKLGLIYDPDTLNANIVDEVVRLTLDVAQAMAAQRHPEVMRIDGFELMRQAERDIDAIRKGLANLGVTGAPEPAANQGGTVTSGDPDHPDYPDASEHFALNGTGSF